mgnify:CR=1 FL=1
MATYLDIINKYGLKVDLIGKRISFNHMRWSHEIYSTPSANSTIKIDKDGDVEVHIATIHHGEVSKVIEELNVASYLLVELFIKGKDLDDEATIDIV